MADGRLISVAVAKRRIRPFVRDFWASNIGTYAGFSDLKYYAPTQADVARILAALDLPTAAGELYDCDDFAFGLRAHVSRFVRESGEFEVTPCIGIGWARFAWVRNGQEDHACNWVLGADGIFRWIEPQDRSIHPATDCPGRLTLLLV